MTVKFVKLVTGDELVTEYEESGSNVILRKAAKISIQLEFTDPPTQPKSRVDVYAPHARHLSFTIAKNHVLFAEEPHPTLLEYYTNTFLKGLPDEQ